MFIFVSLCYLLVKNKPFDNIFLLPDSKLSNSQTSSVPDNHYFYNVLFFRSDTRIILRLLCFRKQNRLREKNVVNTFKVGTEEDKDKDYDMDAVLKFLGEGPTVPSGPKNKK